MPYSGGGSASSITTTGGDEIKTNTAQTPDTLTIGVAAAGRSLLLIEDADDAFDFAHAQQTNPTLFVHSAAQSTNEWISLHHKGAGDSGYVTSGVTGVGLALGTEPVQLNLTDQLILAANHKLGFNSTNDNAATTVVDTFFTREAAAVMQMGADVNGAAVAQTFKAHDGITGTDVAGANLTLAAGRGTGAGASGNLALQAAAGLATGTTAQTLYARQVIVGKAKALTAASATTFVTIGVATGGFTGGFIDYAIVASDGTDHQCRAGMLPFAIVNKADVETGTVGTVGAATEVVAVSSGTLTNTFTIVAATNAMDIKANAASSLTETNLDIYYTVHLNGPATVTPA